MASTRNQLAQMGELKAARAPSGGTDVGNCHFTGAAALNTTPKPVDVALRLIDQSHGAETVIAAAAPATRAVLSDGWAGRVRSGCSGGGDRFGDTGRQGQQQRVFHHNDGFRIREQPRGATSASAAVGSGLGRRLELDGRQWHRRCSGGPKVSALGFECGIGLGNIGAGAGGTGSGGGNSGFSAEARLLQQQHHHQQQHHQQHQQQGTGRPTDRSPVHIQEDHVNCIQPQNLAQQQQVNGVVPPCGPMF